MFGHAGGSIRRRLRDAQNCEGLFFSDRLSAESVRAICEQYQHEFRERMFSPAVTLWVFLSQVLSTDHSCREAIAKLNFWRVAHQQKPCSPQTGSYCQARQRLPERIFLELVRATGRELVGDADPAWNWLGRVVKIVDGSSISMADTSKNQRAYPQPPQQVSGVGFPVARIVVVFSLSVGAILDAAIGPSRGKRTGENSLFRSLLQGFLPGEVVLADRYFASFWDFALLKERQVDLLARAHQIRKIDFRQGKKLGNYDHVVTYRKPTDRPYWMNRTTYARLPKSLEIRHVRYRVPQRGFRPREITLATTLLDVELYTKEELSILFRRRWQAELHLRSLKTHLQMDHLRCKQPDMVRKEFYTHLLAYNLLRGILLEAAKAAHVYPHQLSFKGAMQAFNTFLGMVIADTRAAHRHHALLIWIVTAHRVGNRPDRIEPRMRKRRPKAYKLLTEPRRLAKSRLMKRT